MRSCGGCGGAGPPPKIIVFQTEQAEEELTFLHGCALINDVNDAQRHFLLKDPR